MFGDGAAGMILSPGGQGPLYQLSRNDGRFASLLATQPGLLMRERSWIEMAGKEVFKLAVDHLGGMIQELCGQAGIQVSDVRYIIPHQANIRILKQVSSRLNLLDEVMVMTLKDHANTSSASVPLAFDYLKKHNGFESGDWLLLCAFGAGFSWSGSLLRYKE